MVDIRFDLLKIPAELVQQMRHGMRRCGPASMFRLGAAGDQ
jgi:hypothetical protein